VRLGWAESPVNLTKTEGVVGSLSDIRTIKKIDAKWLLRRRVGDNRLARMNKSGWRIERQPAHHCIGAASVDLNKENGANAEAKKSNRIVSKKLNAWWRFPVIKGDKKSH
jgi:hypothetical protein